MAFKEQPQLSATVVHRLIGDLVQEAVVDHHHVKLNTEPDTCQRLFDILGFQACTDSEDTEDFASILSTDDETKSSNDNIEKVIPCSQCTLYFSPKETKKNSRNWHTWMIDAVGDESSEDEFVLYQSKRNYQFIPQLSTVAVQTEQPRLRKNENSNREVPSIPVPCELTRQMIFIDALNMPLPNSLARPPLADRFCYMLTDFASALYCSLAIMCCCTPNMFR